MAETNLARHLCHLWLEDVSMGPSIHPAMDSYQMFYIVLYQSHPRHVSPSHTLDE